MGRIGLGECVGGRRHRLVGIGCSIGAITTHSTMTTTARIMLNGEKMVSLTGITPKYSSAKLPGVATSSGADADSPACQVPAMPRWAAATSNR